MVASRSDGEYHDSVFHRLRNTARRLAPIPRSDRDLIAKIVHHRTQVEAARNVGAAPTTPTPDDAPEEFVEVLRRTKGEQHYLMVDIDGQNVEMVLNSRGVVDVAREAFLWRWLLKRARQAIT